MKLQPLLCGLLFLVFTNHRVIPLRSNGAQRQLMTMVMKDTLGTRDWPKEKEEELINDGVVNVRGR